MRTYRAKINSRKHILCKRREYEMDSFDFGVVMLIPENEIQGYFDSGFTIVYKWNKVCIVSKSFVLHKETIDTFYDFSEREDLC